MQLPTPVIEVLQRLEHAGFAAYVVGGCVRDALLGVTPHDYDICTAAPPAAVGQALDGIAVYDTGLKHGTVTAVYNHMPIEITTFRTESQYSDCRRPDSVQFVDDITLDLARRDFTICAMAYSPAHGFCDPFHGQQDLQAGILRCVGSADLRFTEDALRILRGMRFMAQLGLKAEPMTALAMQQQMSRLQHISAERIFAELTRMLCQPHIGYVLRQYACILFYILPELAPMWHLDQQNPHHKYDVWEHTVRAVEQVPPESVLRLAMLLHDAGKPATKTIDAQGIGHFYNHPKISHQITDAILTRLRCDNETKAAVLDLVLRHDRPLGDNPRQIRRTLAKIGQLRFRQLLMIKKGDCVGQGTSPTRIGALLETEALLNEAVQSCFSLRGLAVNGRDMLELGLTGEQVGQMLQSLFAHVIEQPKDNTREQLLAYAQRQLEKGGL